MPSTFGSLPAVALSLLALAGVAFADPCSTYQVAAAWDVPGDLRDVSVDPFGNALVSRGLQKTVEIFSPEGQRLRVITCLPGTSYDAVPFDAAASGDGYIFVAVVDVDDIQVFRSDGTFVRRWGGTGTGPGKFSFPSAIAIGVDGEVFVADRFNHRIQVFDSSGNLLRAWGSMGTAPGQFREPFDLVIDAHGDIYVGEHDNDRIQKFDRYGNYLSTFTPGAVLRFGVDGAGNLYIPAFTTDFQYAQIEVFSADGVSQCRIGKAGDLDGEFRHVTALSLGPDGSLVTGDIVRGRITRFVTAPTSASSSTWGALKLRYR